MNDADIVTLVEKTLAFLERSGTERIAQQYLHFALADFAAGKEEQLATYLTRYAIAAHRPVPAVAQLVIEAGQERGRTIALDAYANLIGRDDPQTHSYPNIDLTALDTNAKVSRRHARIYSLDGVNFWIEDLGSFNGTSLNDNRLTPRHPQPLHDGDQIIFGNMAVKFVSTTPPATA
jgi:hypothetical protein